MDESRRRALRQCHPDLRTQIRVNDFLPSLYVLAGGFLNDVESGRIRQHTGNIEQVDEMIDILVTKDNKDFDHFCVVLEEGYHVWSENLREAAGLGKRQQLSGMVTLVTSLFPCHAVHESLIQWQYSFLYIGARIAPCLLCELGAKCNLIVF